MSDPREMAPGLSRSYDMEPMLPELYWEIHRLELLQDLQADCVIFMYQANPSRYDGRVCRHFFSSGDAARLKGLNSYMKGRGLLDSGYEVDGFSFARRYNTGELYYDVRLKQSGVSRWDQVGRWFYFGMFGMTYDSRLSARMHTPEWPEQVFYRLARLGIDEALADTPRLEDFATLVGRFEKLVEDGEQRNLGGKYRRDTAEETLKEMGMLEEGDKLIDIRLRRCGPVGLYESGRMNVSLVGEIGVVAELDYLPVDLGPVELVYVVAEDRPVWFMVDFGSMLWAREEGDKVNTWIKAINKDEDLKQAHRLRLHQQLWSVRTIKGYRFLEEVLGWFGAEEVVYE